MSAGTLSRVEELDLSNNALADGGIDALAIAEGGHEFANSGAVAIPRVLRLPVQATSRAALGR